MDETLYKAPETEVANRDGTEAKIFYVVSLKKFIILFVATLALYAVYWFYKNWSLYKARHNVKMVPALRGIFSIFFVHSLLSKVNAELQENGTAFHWRPMLHATAYVLLSLVNAAIDAIPAEGVQAAYVSALSVLISPLLVVTLIRPQQAINASQGDPEGSINDSLTPANYVWIGVGIILWALSLFGIAVMFGWGAGQI